MIAQLEVERVDETTRRVFLDADQKSPAAKEFEAKLSNRIVGQDRAVRHTSALFQIFLAGMNPSNRPVGTMLFLGPTGSGKTRVVEAAAEVLFGDPHAIVKIDCAEFQHSHEIAKLIGSPPGYLGHRETSPMLTQENLDRMHTKDTKLTFVLFDEIEKASDSLWRLLLGILDKATLTLGDNRRVDFSRAIVILTSNLGAREMSELISGGIGFAPGNGTTDPLSSEVDQKIFRTAVEAARRKFLPEFMNRIDKVVVFRGLQEHDLRKILDLELQALQERIIWTASTKVFFHCSDAAKEMLLREGIDRQYGARSLKRSIEIFLVQPLSNLMATGQVVFGDSVYVDTDASDKLVFSKHSDPALIDELQHLVEKTEQSTPKAAAVAPHLTNAKTAVKRSEFGGLEGWCF